MIPSVFPSGIHVPALTFFRDDARQEIDWEIQEKHLEFLIASGLHGSKYLVSPRCFPISQEDNYN